MSSPPSSKGFYFFDLVDGMCVCSSRSFTTLAVMFVGARSWILTCLSNDWELVDNIGSKTVIARQCLFCSKIRLTRGEPLSDVSSRFFPDRRRGKGPLSGLDLFCPMARFR